MFELRKDAANAFSVRIDPSLAGALERASRAIARLDQALDGAMRIIDRGVIFDAARHALTLHQWLTVPDFDQEGEVKQAEAALAMPEFGLSPLLSAAPGVHAWLDQDGTRPPVRSALVRHWTRHRLLHSPIPLTGAAALSAETSWAVDAWIPVFLNALANEADDGRQLLLDLERAWFNARRAMAGRRANSRAAIAVDLLAAAPLLSAASLAAGLGMAMKNALQLLDSFCADGIAIEVTHRSRRRLFGLAGLAPLRDEVSPPHRPEPGRGRGRPPTRQIDEELLPASFPPPARPMTPIERRTIDYSELEGAMAHLEITIRDTRRALDGYARQISAPSSPDPGNSGDDGCIGESEDRL